MKIYYHLLSSYLILPVSETHSDLLNTPCQHASNRGSWEVGWPTPSKREEPKALQRCQCPQSQWGLNPYVIKMFSLVSQWNPPWNQCHSDSDHHVSTKNTLLKLNHMLQWHILVRRDTSIHTPILYRFWMGFRWSSCSCSWKCLMRLRLTNHWVKQSGSHIFQTGVLCRWRRIVHRWHMKSLYKDPCPWPMWRRSNQLCSVCTPLHLEHHTPCKSFHTQRLSRWWKRPWASNSSWLLRWDRQKRRSRQLYRW